MSWSHVWGQVTVSWTWEWCLGLGTVPQTWGHDLAEGCCLKTGAPWRPGLVSATLWGHTFEDNISQLGTPAGFAAMGQGGTDQPRVSPPAPSRSTSPAATNISRSPPCARAAFKSQPRKKAQIKYYRCLFMPGPLFSTANEGDFPCVGGRSLPPPAPQSRGPLGDPPRPLYLLHLGTNIPGGGRFYWCCRGRGRSAFPLLLRPPRQQSKQRMPITGVSGPDLQPWSGRGDVTACLDDVTSFLSKPVMSAAPQTNPKKVIWLLDQSNLSTLPCPAQSQPELPPPAPSQDRESPGGTGGNLGTTPPNLGHLQAQTPTSFPAAPGKPD